MDGVQHSQIVDSVCILVEFWFGTIIVVSKCFFNSSSSAKAPPHSFGLHKQR